MVYHSQVIECMYQGSTGTYYTKVKSALPDGSTQECIIESDILVNAAGLHAHHLSNMVKKSKNPVDHIDRKVYYCKGHYFLLKNGSRKGIKRLIYPIPDKLVTSLGFHLTLDLVGDIRFGYIFHYTFFYNYVFLVDQMYIFKNLLLIIHFVQTRIFI